MVSPKGSVLLTGANGFVASHIVAGLIALEYHIVGTVRSEKKAQNVIALHPDWKQHITWAYISDIGLPSAFDEVFKNMGPFDYVIHNASPVDFTVSDFQKDMIDPAVRGTTSLLEAAQRLGGKRLKRVVLSGSTSSISDYFQSDAKAREKLWNEEDWNSVTAEYAVKNNDVVAAYIASKTLAERAAWSFVATRKPTYDVTVLNPYVIMGPMLHAVHGPEDIPSTNAFPVWSFLNGAYKSIDGLKFPAWYFIDVRDVARAHILSLTNPLASNKRIILVSGLLTPQLVINAIRKNFPELKERIMEGKADKVLPDGVELTGWDTKRSFEVFGEKWEYKGLEETVVDLVQQLVDLEKEWDA